MKNVTKALAHILAIPIIYSPTFRLSIPCLFFVFSEKTSSMCTTKMEFQKQEGWPQDYSQEPEASKMLLGILHVLLSLRIAFAKQRRKCLPAQQGAKSLSTLDYCTKICHRTDIQPLYACSVVFVFDSDSLNRQTSQVFQDRPQVWMRCQVATSRHWCNRCLW